MSRERTKTRKTNVHETYEKRDEWWCRGRRTVSKLVKKTLKNVGNHYGGIVLKSTISVTNTQKKRVENV